MRVSDCGLASLMSSVSVSQVCQCFCLKTLNNLNKWRLVFEFLMYDR